MPKLVHKLAYKLFFIRTSTSTLLTDKTLQHHISIKFISINYKYKKYNIIFQGDKI